MHRDLKPANVTASICRHPAPKRSDRVSRGAVLGQDSARHRRFRSETRDGGPLLMRTDGNAEKANTPADAVGTPA